MGKCHTNIRNSENFSPIAFIAVSLVLSCTPEEKTPAREVEKQTSEHGGGVTKGVIEVAPNGLGSITGTVKLQGKVPERKRLGVTIDQYACGEEKLSEELVVSGSGGIKNVVVYLKDISVRADEQRDKTYQLDQRKCQFVPHVLVVPAGAKVEVPNSDKILHNFHTFSTKNKPKNKNQPRHRKVMNVSFKLPEIVKVQCDVHGWMNGWIVVAEHPYYAITDEKGAFRLDHVPAGTYTLEVRQEVLGSKKIEKVSVDEGIETKVEIELI